MTICKTSLEEAYDLEHGEGAYRENQRKLKIDVFLKDPVMLQVRLERTLRDRLKQIAKENDQTLRSLITNALLDSIA